MKTPKTYKMCITGPVVDGVIKDWFKRRHRQGLFFNNPGQNQPNQQEVSQLYRKRFLVLGGLG